MEAHDSNPETKSDNLLNLLEVKHAVWLHLGNIPSISIDFYLDQ